MTEPATVVITRIVKRGREAEYRNWVVRLIAEAEAFPNNLGTVVLSPSSDESSVYRLIHRFVDEPSLQAWEESTIFRQLTAEADAFSTSQRQEATGMEAWFSLSDAPSHTPKKWKMALVTFFVVYALTAVIIPREMKWLPKTWSFYEINIITNVLIATLMTFVIMPSVVRVLRRALY